VTNFQQLSLHTKHDENVINFCEKLTFMAEEEKKKMYYYGEEEKAEKKKLYYYGEEEKAKKE